MDTGIRRSERIEILGTLEGDVTVVQPMRVRQISADGASVETSIALQVDSLHELKLALGATPVVIKGRVVHSRVSDVDQDVVTYRTGIEFVELTQHAREAIQEFLKSLKAGRAV